MARTNAYRNSGVDFSPRARKAPRKTFLEVSRAITLWLISCAILFLSCVEAWTARSVVCVCIGAFAAGIVLPPVRGRLRKVVRSFLTPKMSALMVFVALGTQLAFFEHGVIAMADAQTLAQPQRLLDETEARQQALAKEFASHKSSILEATLNTMVPIEKL